MTHLVRLRLTDFRSYPSLDLAVPPGLVVLTGDNGAGKTNVLEALSFLAVGRGLRRADLAECARVDGPGAWAVAVEAQHDDSLVQIGTGFDPAQASTRRCRIDREPVGSARAFADIVRVVWLTPAMDGLFTGPPGERRRFLDRLVLAVDADHGTRVNALDRALRSRNRLLEDGGRQRVNQAAWLDAIERELAEIAIAVAAARVETVTRLNAAIAARRDDASPFPWAALALDGLIEAALPGEAALDIEDRYRDALREARSRDAAAGRTLLGPQATDLKVQHGPKAIAAAQASTGEQKALLVGLVLAHARLVAAMSGVQPLVLLDEIAAHFDPTRRRALYADLASLGGQVWMSGADPAAFAEAGPAAARFHVTPGRIEPLDGGRAPTP